MIEDFEDSALNELKRVDHLIYVSLKYTRTCDVMKSIIKRLISSFEMSFDDVLKALSKEDKISELQLSPKEKAQRVKEYFGSKVRKYMNLYSLLKKIDNSEYDAFEEFRKNVTMVTRTTKPIKVKVDTLYDYYATTKNFVNFINKWAEEKK